MKLLTRSYNPDKKIQIKHRFQGGNQYRSNYKDGNVKIVDVIRSDANFVHLEWSDGHVGQYAITPEGIYGNGTKPAPSDEDVKVTLRERLELWPQQPQPHSGFLAKQWDWEELVKEKESVRQMLLHFMKYGLAFIHGVPQEKGLRDIVNDDLACGPIWDTIFGTSSEVKAVANASNEAYSNDYLEAHIDLPYYTQPPSVFFFYCKHNTAMGGESFWVDTFSILEQLRVTHPDYFLALTRTKVTFHAFSPGLDKVFITGTYPSVELNDSGSIYRYRDLFFARDNYQFINDVPVEERALWWEAYLYLRQQVGNLAWGGTEMVIYPGCPSVLANPLSG
eukprot:sb/3466561/